MEEKQLKSKIEKYLDKKEDFDNLLVMEKIKYMCYFYVKIINDVSFSPKEIEHTFKVVSLNLPSNTYVFFSKLSKKDILIKIDGKYRLHRSVIKELDFEFSGTKKEKEESKNPLHNIFNLLDIHPKIREVSEERFYKKDYSVAIEKAFMRVIKLVQKKSVKSIDGTSLMENVFSANNPILAFNELKNQSDRDEQKGMMDLYKGSVECIRNVRFHEEIEEDEEIMTLHLLIFSSFLAKRLDETNKI